MKIHKEYAKNIIRLGLPSGITQAILSMAMIVVQSLTKFWERCLLLPM